MNVQLSQTVSLQFSKGFWNIEHIVNVNTTHHLAKNETCTEIDNYGDLNRCITALNRYSSIEPEIKQKLRNTYIQILKDFKSADTFNFETRMRWTVAQGEFKHTVATNKNHHGYMVNYTMKSSHGKSVSGATENEFTANSHSNAAETLLNKTVANELSSNSFDDFITTLQHTANNITQSLLTAQKI